MVNKVAYRMGNIGIAYHDLSSNIDPIMEVGWDGTIRPEEVIRSFPLDGHSVEVLARLAVANVFKLFCLREAAAE